MSEIKVRQWAAPLACRRGTILETALANGVPYPHSCRSGECGNCRTQMLSGDVDHDPYDPAVLSDDDRQAGIVLACRARPRGDVEVTWLGDVDPGTCFPVRKLRARVVAIEIATHDVIRIRLAVRGRPLLFAAGQYAYLSFGGQPPRPYSMANRPDEPELEFHIRHVPNGQASGYVASQLRVGDCVQVRSPFGNSHLREQHPGPIVAVAGSTGLAPVLSIVRTALARMSARPIHIYLGVQDERDVYCESELLELANNHPHVTSHIVLSKPSQDTSRRAGLVHESVHTDLPQLNGTKVYVAGSPGMVYCVKKVALAHGATADDVHSDPFIPSDTNTPSKAKKSWTSWKKRLLGLERTPKLRLGRRSLDRSA